jgi:cob(I)alamin adenosyltransferase
MILLLRKLDLEINILKIMKNYEKISDSKNTELFGGTIVKKNDIRIDVYGTIDEMNAHLGMIRSFNLNDETIEFIIYIQEKLFEIGSKIASDEIGKQITDKILCDDDSDIKRIEDFISICEQNLPKLKNFVLPGGDQIASACCIARTVCRRTERLMVELSEKYSVQENDIKFVNRLSDFLFVLSRKIMSDNNSKEFFWNYKK